MSAFVVLAEKEMKHVKRRMEHVRTFETQLIDFFAYATSEEDGSNRVALNSIFADVDELIKMLSISKVKLKQLEKENKRREMRQQRKLRRKTKRSNTEHLTRNRFQALLHKSKEKTKHKTRRHSKHKLREESHDPMLSLQDGMNTEGKSKSRQSRHFDRAKHSSFELFTKIHADTKKKNIRFKMDMKETESNDADEALDSDSMALNAAAVPGSFQSKSVQGLHSIGSVNPISIIHDDDESLSNSESRDLSLTECNALTLSLTTQELVQQRRFSDPGTPAVSAAIEINHEANDRMDETLQTAAKGKPVEDNVMRIDRTSNIRVSIKRSTSNAKKKKRKKKNKNGNGTDKKRKPKKDKNKSKLKSTKRAKSTRYAADITASFF